MTYPTVGQDEFPAVCPYLGLADDADSHATYATEAHRCYRLPSPTRIATGHQESYCLGESHTQCPVYRGEGIPKTAPPPAGAPPPRAEQVVPVAPPRPARQPRPAPGDAREPRRRPAPGTVGPRPRAGGISMPVATIGLFAGAILVIIVAFLVQQALSGDDNGGVSPTDAVATNAAATKTASTGKTPTTAATQTQQPGTPGTGTATKPATTGTPGTPGTTTPGTGAKTYTVKAGDFCGTIAEAHNVTLAAFMAANPEIDATCSNLKIDQVVKIP